MDKSPEYITMCAWPEIQGRWKPAVGDWTDKGVVVGIIVSSLVIHSHAIIIDGVNHSFAAKGLTWLPLQWQSQEMVFTDNQKPLYMTGQIDMFACHPHVPNFDTMQQLWLAFVIHELHEKVWIGEKWEEE